jgi:hypothetical protein
VPFAIDDGTGRALIDPRGAELAIEISERQMTLGEPTEIQRRLAATHGISPGANLFREGILAIGARVSVIGMAVREPDPDGAARATDYRCTPTRLRVSGTPARPLRITRA